MSGGDGNRVGYGAGNRDVVKILPTEYPDARWVGVFPVGEIITPAMDGVFDVAAYFPSLNGMGQPHALVVDMDGVAIEFPMERLRIQRDISHDYNGPTGQFYKPQQAND